MIYFILFYIFYNCVEYTFVVVIDSGSCSFSCSLSLIGVFAAPKIGFIDFFHTYMVNRKLSNHKAMATGKQ